MEPKLYEGQAPLQVSADMVFAAVKAIMLAGEEEGFLRVCNERNISVTVSGEVVNFVKTYLSDAVNTRNEASSAMATRVIDSDRCTPLGGG